MPPAWQTYRSTYLILINLTILRSNSLKWQTRVFCLLGPISNLETEDGINPLFCKDLRTAFTWAIGKILIRSQVLFR